MKNARRAAAAGHKTTQRPRRPPVRRRTALNSRSSSPQNVPLCTVITHYLFGSREPNKVAQFIVQLAAIRPFWKLRLAALICTTRART